MLGRIFFGIIMDLVIEELLIKPELVGVGRGGFRSFARVYACKEI